MTDPNYPLEQEDEHDTAASRLVVWTGIPNPRFLFDVFEVAFATPGCLCLSLKGQKPAAAVMLECRRECEGTETSRALVCWVSGLNSCFGCFARLAAAWTACVGPP